MLEDSLKMDVNEYLPLRDVVFKTLRQAILTGEFMPGERLMEVTLANRLGVSRTPVREAIRKLELEGLVVMVPRKGAEVARITVSDLKDVLEVHGVMRFHSGKARVILDDEGEGTLKCQSKEGVAREIYQKIRKGNRNEVPYYAGTHVEIELPLKI